MSEKDLLFAALSVRFGLAREEDVLGYAETFVRDPSQTIADRLEADGKILPEQRQRIFPDVRMDPQPDLGTGVG